MTINVFLKKFEHAVVLSLIGMMIVVVFISTIELGWIIIKDIIKPPMFWLEIRDLLEIFGFFLLVLIGVELLETIKAYLDEDRVHAEVVLLVALVAVARKVIIFDQKEMSPQLLFGMSALIFSLSVGYIMVRYALRKLKLDQPQDR